MKWAGLNTAQQSALKRLFGWIRSCVPANATADDLGTFVSEKFRTEIGQYFDVDHLLTYYVHTDYFASVDQRAKNILLRTWDGLVWYTTYYDGDTQLAKRNDCFLAYDYTLDRDTWDAEAGKYAFEGRDSWLWNLVLANLQDELKACAAAYRAKMTVDRVLSMLDVEQAGNWSDRAYNKSGYLKYIRPNMEEVYGKKWPFIYALQGSNAAHRSYFVKNRFALLDAKYGTYLHRCRRRGEDHGERGVRLRLRHEQQPQYRGYRHRGGRQGGHPSNHGGLHGKRPPAYLRREPHACA